MGGGTPRTSAANRATPRSPAPRPDRPRLSPFRHSCAPLPPLLRPSSRHSCAGRNHPTSHPASPIHPPHTTKRARSSPIHPSPLSGGRLGGGWNATNQRRQSRHAPIARATPQSPAPRPDRPRLSPFRHSCAPLPSFLRRQEPAPPLLRHPCTPPPSFLRPSSVIPAQAGTTEGGGADPNGPRTNLNIPEHP